MNQRNMRIVFTNRPILSVQHLAKYIPIRNLVLPTKSQMRSNQPKLQRIIVSTNRFDANVKWRRHKECRLTSYKQSVSLKTKGRSVCL